MLGLSRSVVLISTGLSQHTEKCVNTSDQTADFFLKTVQGECCNFCVIWHQSEAGRSVVDI